MSSREESQTLLTRPGTEREEALIAELVSNHGWNVYRHLGKPSLSRIVSSPKVANDATLFGTFDSGGNFLVFDLGSHRGFCANTLHGSLPEAAQDLTEKFDTWAASAGSISAEHVSGQTNQGAREVNVPPAVLGHVRFALSELNEQARALAGVQSARGNGFILALELRSRTPAINRAKTTLQKFRDLARVNGVDPEAVIVAMGGEPELAKFGEPAAPDEEATGTLGATATRSSFESLHSGPVPLPI
jgi:hypothetical protein